MEQLVTFHDRVLPYNEELPYVGLANVQSNFGTLINIGEQEEQPSGMCRLFHKGQLLYGKLRPYLNKVYLAQEDGQCSPEFYVMSMKDEGQILTSFFEAFLSSKSCLSQTVHMMTGNTHPRIQRDDFKDILVPIPPLQLQKDMLLVFQVARERRLKYIADAEQAFAKIDAFLLDALRLTDVIGNAQTVCAVRRQQLQDALNSERYLGMGIEKRLRERDYVLFSDVAQILESKVIPSGSFPTMECDIIRIDDIENNPLGVDTIRTGLGNEFKGGFFPVEENDILLARLGPTLLNHKCVLCPPIQRPTFASPEFLVLRCREGWNPIIVTWILRLNLYTKLMYSKTRGSTPSRYRLIREDLETTTFPCLDHIDQDAVAKQINAQLEQIGALRQAAAREWKEAKAEFERKLLEA